MSLRALETVVFQDLQAGRSTAPVSAAPEHADTGSAVETLVEEAHDRYTAVAEQHSAGNAPLIAVQQASLNFSNDCRRIIQGANGDTDSVRIRVQRKLAELQIHSQRISILLGDLYQAEATS